MKFSAAIPRSKPQLAPLLIPLFLFSHSFANSMIAGGYVPENRKLFITPTYGAALSRPEQAAEVAVIEIDNNLPNYELVLDFSDRFGDPSPIANVSFQRVDGTLGEGLSTSLGSVLSPGENPGQFLWRPGRQESATVGCKLRVMVTYRVPISEQPLMRVSMPAFF